MKQSEMVYIEPPFNLDSTLVGDQIGCHIPKNDPTGGCLCNYYEEFSIKKKKKIKSNVS